MALFPGRLVVIRVHDLVARDLVFEELRDLVCEVAGRSVGAIGASGFDTADRRRGNADGCRDLALRDFCNMEAVVKKWCHLLDLAPAGGYGDALCAMLLFSTQ